MLSDMVGEEGEGELERDEDGENWLCWVRTVRWERGDESGEDSRDAESEAEVKAREEKDEGAGGRYDRPERVGILPVYQRRSQERNTCSVE